MRKTAARTIVYALSLAIAVTGVMSRTVSAGEVFPAEESVPEREFSLYGGAALLLGEDIEAEGGLPVCGAALTMGEDLTLEQLPYIPVREKQLPEEEVCAEAEPEEENVEEPAAVEAAAAEYVPTEAAAPAATEEPAAPAAEVPAAEEPVPEAEEPAAEEPAPEPEEPAAEEPVPEAEEPAAEEPAPEDNGSDVGQRVADFALQFVGGPYKYGGCSLTEGADCSGFVMAVYAHFGVSLPHSSTADRGVGRHVEGGLTAALPGDIICYGGHVGIYIGNGQIVHAFNSRKGIVTTNADYDTVLEVRRIF